MVRPQGIIDGVLYALQRSDNLPDNTNFVGYTPDIDSEAIKLPLIEVSPGPQEKISVSNSEFVRFRTDSDGNDIGKVYEACYNIEITVAAWTAQGSKYSPREMGNIVRDELYRYETAGPNQKLLDPEDDSTIDEVWNFAMQQGEQTDDLNTSPTLRRWQQQVLISASEQYITDADDAPTSATNVNEALQ